MAARINPFHDEKTRARIRDSQLVSRLIMLAEGSIKPDMMPPHAVTAALGLLKKTIPDLQAMQLTGDSENPLHMAVSLNGLDDNQLRALASIKIGE